MAYQVTFTATARTARAVMKLLYYWLSPTGKKSIFEVATGKQEETVCI